MTGRTEPADVDLLSVTGMRRPHLSWVPEDTGQLLVAGGGAGGPGSAAAGRSSRRAGCTTHPYINPYPNSPNRRTKCKPSLILSITIEIRSQAERQDILPQPFAGCVDLELPSDHAGSWARTARGCCPPCV